MRTKGRAFPQRQSRNRSFVGRPSAYGRVPCHRKEYALDLGVVFSRLNVERDGKVLYLPWYAAPFIGQAIGNDTHDTRGLRMTPPSL